MEAQINKLNLSGSIVLGKAEKDIRSIYQDASVLALSSHYEGLPMVLIEAQEYQLPIVAFDCPYGPNDIITHNENGFLIPLDNDDAFIHAVCKLMDSHSLRQEMGLNAKKHSIKYNQRSIILRWKQFFSSLSQQ